MLKVLQFRQTGEHVICGKIGETLGRSEHIRYSEEVMALLFSVM